MKGIDYSIYLVTDDDYLDRDGIYQMIEQTLQNGVTLLQYRAQMSWQTVLTPHPLEAARLLGKADATEVQADRLKAARDLVKRFNCVVVLKGSGSLIAGPGMSCRINATGNGRLATAGTGDVLAGYIGALLAQGMPAFEAACAAVRRHGEVADAWSGPGALTAQGLAARL